jgi:hypothetical protein
VTPRWLARAAPALLLALGVAFAHAEVWRAGAAQVAPLMPEGAPDFFPEANVPDVSFEAWLVARNARTLISRPWRLYDTEHCFPETQSITFGVSLVGLSVLAVPAALFTREPLLVYNFALLAWSATAALAMYLLVARWTRRRAAGVVAALLFAFHPLRLANITHPTVWDLSFTVFALYFAERLFREGRWRDAAGLAAALALQVAADYYPLVAASLTAAPFAVWLWLRRAPRRASALQIALPVAAALAAVYLVLGPYLEARSAGTLPRYDGGFHYARWAGYAPSAPLFFGRTLVALALAGAVAPRALPGVAGDPRPALDAGAALALLVAAGPDTGAQLGRVASFAAGFDPHALLAALLPGLSSVRVVERLSLGALCVACVLAGAGSAWLLARSGRHRDAVAGALAVAALVACFGMLAPRYQWRLEPIHPGEAPIAFFRELEVQGNTGALFERCPTRPSARPPRCGRRSTSCSPPGTGGAPRAATARPRCRWPRSSRSSPCGCPSARRSPSCAISASPPWWSTTLPARSARSRCWSASPSPARAAGRPST